VGVDVILTASEAFVIEVNPRLTTAYLGVRSALDRNVADMVLAACAGRLPDPSPPRRSVRFTAGGRILHSQATGSTTGHTLSHGLSKHR
jgi:predicted ATP-grasp superfamily ATP-dependent carboligase